MARSFNGTSDNIQYGSETAIDNLMGFTACAFMRITSDVAVEMSVVSKFRSDYGAGRLFISAAGDGVDNNKIFTLVKTSATDVSAETVAGVLELDTWKVVVTTWPGTIAGEQAHIYICTLGGAMAEASYTAYHPGSGTNLDDSSASFRLGSRDAADTFYAGGLAECALWNRVLSTDEIAALGRGYSPLFFPYGRVLYSPVDGRTSPERNVAGTSGTVTGTSYLDHPSIIYPVANAPLARPSGGGSPPPVGRIPHVATRSLTRALGRAL